MYISTWHPFWCVFLFAAHLAAAPLSVQEFRGRVVGTHDGDSITVRTATETFKIRLEGIDAPELGQAFGRPSRQALSKLVSGREVRLLWRERDRYNRILAHVYVGDVWVNRELVANGWAWHFKKYNHTQRLADAELAARKAKVGLWKDATPVAPWDYRAQEAAKRAAKRAPAQSLVTHLGPAPTIDNAPSSAATNDSSPLVYVTDTGKKYHRDGCRYLDHSQHALSLVDAAASYSPCKVCNPPPPPK